MDSLSVLLDTDIGSDIDDAICLAYLLAQPRCDLLGITTVTGQGQKRAMIASALCKRAGKVVPIYVGAEKPLLIAQRQTEAPQAAALSSWEHDTSFPGGQAVEYMRQTIHAHPGQVVLLAIGPLTNVALLFAVDAQIPSLLKGLVLMCGSFTRPRQKPARPEWNASLDPQAAAMVYAAPVAIHRSVGLDVTTQVTMEASEVRHRFSKGLLQPVLDLAEVWFRQRPMVTFHDPLAAVTIFDAGVCTFAPGLVEVELEDKSAGMTYWQASGPAARHQVALHVDRDRFFEHFFSVVP